VVLLVLGWLYASQGPRQVMAGLRDPVQAPFVAVPAITAMMLGAALAGVSFAAGRALVVVFLAVTMCVGGWLGGQWITGGLDPASVHPGYYLPTVAGGLVGAITLSQVHLHALAQASFGAGIVSWVILGSVVLNRLMTAQRLPAALQPVTAIELAPPALAGVAWFALAARGATVIAYAIGGYLVLMALVQIRLVPVYRKLRFSPGFWAFTFSYAIAITCALEWITRTNPPGATGYAIAAITAITVFVGAIAARSLTAVARGQFLAQPADGPPAPRTPAPGSLPARPAGSRHRHRLHPAPGTPRCQRPGPSPVNARRSQIPDAAPVVVQDQRSGMGRERRWRAGQRRAQSRRHDSDGSVRAAQLQTVASATSGMRASTTTRTPCRTVS